MAKKQIKKYSFTPGVAGDSVPTFPTSTSGVGKVVIPGNWPIDRILLITNVTAGVILYNFADTQNTGAYTEFRPGGIPTSNADDNVVTYGKDLFGEDGSAVIQSVESGHGETTVFFTNIDTSSHNDTDLISVLVEESYMSVRPWNDFGTDAIERARVAMPQTMIDADFEYGLQPTKWQGFQTVASYPSIFESVTPDLVVTDVTTDGATTSLITVTSAAHGLAAGDPITISTLLVTIDGYHKAEGAFIVYSAPTSGTFTFYAKGLVGTNGQSLKDNRTQVRKGGFYSGSDLPLSSFVSDGAGSSTVTLTFSSPHGFVPGMPIIVTADPSYNGGALAGASGSYYVSQVSSATTCTFTARGTIGTTPVTTSSTPHTIAAYSLKVYARPDGFFTHRPGDGGVLLGTSSAIHGASAVRQSKKYFRYQSGKGMLYTTGVLFAPNYDITAITSSGTTVPSNNSTSGTPVTISITTSVPHNLQIGAVIRVRGVATQGYDGTYTVSQIDSEYGVTVRAINNQNLGSTTGAVTAVPKLYMYQWHGACIRTGPHDDSNGMFFEYDGQYFNVVKRTSTLQLAGTATITPNSNTLSGTNTLWTQQLAIGSKVVVKGMVHRVTSITSDTQISVSPDFRGVTGSSGNYIWIVQEVRVQQPDFNRDTALGTGGYNNASGYKLDPNHMQMVGIQFSWYGAGFMDFMVRGQDGNFIILHRMKQNNVNVTASMRSANLPVRYEVINEAAAGVTRISPLVSGGIDANDTELAVNDASFFPDSGTVLVENEIISYAARDLTQNPHRLTGLTRADTLDVYIGGSNYSFTGVTATTHAENVGVELISLTATPNMSHWGSSYIIDGGFDFDRGYQFSYTVTNANVTTSGNTIVGLRLSPSASNSTVGDLGERELLNRAQILLKGIEISCADQRAGGNVQVLVTGMLNPNNYSESSQIWNALNTVGYGNQPSFSQTTANCWFKTQTYTGQDGQIAQPGEKVFEFVYDPTTKQTLDLSNIKELAQSAIGGRGTYPNGADTLYINMQALPGAVTDNGTGGSTGITGATTNLRFVSNVHVTLQWVEAQA